MIKRRMKRLFKQLDAVPLPEKEKILSTAGVQGFDYGGEAKRTRKLSLRPIAVLCTVFLLSAGAFSVYAVASEMKEYNEAVTFFKTYNLSNEDLSRGDIKRVYRDITTGTFSYEKTADVLEKSASVMGYEINQEKPTPKDVENLWNFMNGKDSGNWSRSDDPSVSYRYYSLDKLDEKKEFLVHDKSVFEKYENDRLIWTAEFEKFWIDNYTANDKYILVYGVSPAYSTTQKRYAWMALMDQEGKILWEKMLNNGFSSEYIGAAIIEEDGVTVFSRGDLEYLCMNRFDMNGERQVFNKTEVGNYGIWNAARLGNGYVVQLGSYTEGEYSRIVKVSDKGDLTQFFYYETDEDIHYRITDMTEYGGALFLSAYSVPAYHSGGGRLDIAPILDYIFSNKLFDISNEELTERVRDNFTAVLLKCDPETGEPMEFYSVKGSLGGKLSVNDAGNLVWKVESITDTFFSPYTSAFTIGGVSSVYRYTFDKSGRLSGQEKTDETVRFYR
jgi:hypothetical protein